MIYAYTEEEMLSICIELHRLGVTFAAYKNYGKWEIELK